MNNVIYIDIKDYESAFNEFNDKYISDSLFNYITSEYSKTKNVIIKITGVKEGKQEKLYEAIRYTFKEKYKNYIKLDKFDDWYRFLLLILGILFVTLNQIFEIYFLKEIMLVAAWVVIWETVYDFLFKGSGRKIKSKMYKSLINAIVEFE